MHDFNHILELLTTSFAETLWPTRCISCDAPGSLLCPDCTARLPYIDPALACRTCGAPYGRLTCTECTDAHADELREQVGGELPPPFPFTAARAAVSYEGVAKRLITSYKDAGEQRLDHLLATLLLRAIHATPPPDTDEPGDTETLDDWSVWADLIVAIPSRAQALRTRGFDHMQRIAELVSRWSGLPLACPLAHARKVADQRELDIEQRALNLSGSLSLARDADVSQLRDSHILLIDDVLTTGATTSAAACALLQEGAREVRVAVVARVW